MLRALIVKSINLPSLEQNWKIVKNNLIYSSNQALLNDYYQTRQNFFQLSERVESLKSNNVNGWKWLTIISLIVMGGLLVKALLNENYYERYR